MIDLASSPPVGPQLSNVGTQSQSSLANNLATTLKAVPALSESPGTAVAVAMQPGNTVTHAEAVGRAASAASAADSANAVAKPTGGTGDIGRVFGWLGHAVTSTVHEAAALPADAGKAVMDGVTRVGKILNYPLSQVQHEYRYLHDVEARHGMMAALGEGLAMGVGAAAGTLVEPGEGTVLGAEAVGQVLGRVAYKDSWQRTANGATYRDPHTGAPVSIGRDISSFITGSRKGLGYDALSGVIDGTFDMTADPLAQAGKVYGAAHTLDGANGLLGAKWSGIGVRAGDYSGEDVQRAYDQYRGVRNAFSQLAGLTPGEVVQRYPQLGPIADRLGAAQTPEEVKSVFSQVFRAAELITTDRLPTMSFTRRIAQEARIAAGNAPQLGDVAYNAVSHLGSGHLAQAAGRVGDVAETLVGPNRWARRLERLPDVYNPATKDFSSKEFSPGDNYGANAVYHLLREGETPQVASDVTTEFVTTKNIGRRIQIYRNALLNAIAARAHIDPAEYGAFADVDTRKAIKEALDTLTRGALPGVSGHYGNAMDARDLSKVITDDGAEHAAAVLPNQTGMLRIPSARDFRDAAATLRGGRDLFGRADSFLYNHVTQNYFKRLVLLTMSYAEHITAAEVIPNGLRVGFTNLIRSGIQMNRALGALSNSDVEMHIGAIRGIVFKLLRMDRGAIPENGDVQLAARWVHMLEGYTTPTSLSSGEAISGEVRSVEQDQHLFRMAMGNAPTKLRYSKTFLTYGRADEHYADAWQSVLHEMSLSPDNEVARLGAEEFVNAARDGLDVNAATGRAAQAMTRYLDSMPSDWLSQYERTTLHSSPDVPEGMTHTEDWARVIAEHIKGATFSPDGQANISLLRHIAEGEKVPTQELDAIPANMRPLVVKGRQIVPTGDNIVARIANRGFKNVLNPFVNLMSREPMAFDEFKRQWAMVQPGIESGAMTEDEAMVTAMHRTATRAVRFVHNLHDRTQWTDTMRNFAPFYFAQEQAYRRMGRMLAEDPGAFRRYQMMISALQNFATKQNSGTGQSYAVIPGTGFLTQGVMDALHALHVPTELATPVGMGWNVTSANVIFPFSESVRPGVGPVYAIPSEALAGLFPESLPSLKASVTGIANEIAGGAASSEPIWQQLIPNTIAQRLAVAAQANSSSFNSAMISTLQGLAYRHELPPEGAGPIAMQNFLDKVRNQTRILFVMKAIVGAVTPVSPELQPQNYGFPQELTADINKTGSAIAGTQLFIEKNPNATPWTVFRSHGTAGAVPLASQQAEDWLNANHSFLSKYQYGGIYFMPQLKDTKYNSTVYNEQIAQGYRTRYTPAEYLNQLYIIAGNNEYYQNYAIYQQASADLSGSALSNMYNQWSAWVTIFSAQHPIWAASYNTDQSAINRTQAILQMKQAIASGEAPKGSLTDGIKTLLAGYDSYVNSVNVGKTDNYTHAENEQLKTNWQDYLLQTAQQEPELSSVINGVFLYAPK